MTQWLHLLPSARIFDLAQPYFAGMPHHPSHPPFLFGLVKRHGDYLGPQGHSSACDAFSMGCHVGTHIDALCHFSCGGMLYGGEPAEPAQSYSAGVEKFAIDTVAPILRRGVLLDIARLHGGALSEDHEITAADLEAASATENVEVRSGDVVLLRTGWAPYFADARRFISGVRGPGPALSGARWLSARQVFAAGSDTVAFEKVPDAAMPVHVHLLVECGIHIVECLNLEDLAQAGVFEFLFVALPLKIRGATASPLRPIAIA